MLVQLLTLLRRSLAFSSFGGMMWLPVVMSAFGAVVLATYLAQQGNLGTDLALIVLAPWGGAIALTLLAAKTTEQRLTELEQRYQDVQTALQNRERWLQQYSELSPGNIYILVQTTAGQIYFEFMSLAIESIHEIPAERILQDAMVLLKRIHPDDQEAYEHAVRQSGEHLTPFNHQWRIITPSGKVKWLQGNSQPELRANGDLAWYGVVIEITELKQAEVARAENEHYYRAILDAIPDLMIRMHRDGTYLDIKLTDAFPLIISAADVGRNIMDLLPEDVAYQRLNAAEEVLKSGNLQVFEFPLQVGDQLLWEEVRILPLNEDEVFLIIRDISQRRQIEHALHQSEANLLQAQNIAQVGSWVLNPETGEMQWSEELCRIFGLQPGTSIPHYPDVLSLIPLEERAMLKAQVEKAIVDHVPYEIEHRILAADGTVRWVVSRGQRADEQLSQQFKLCGTVTDITERKLAEIALQESEARFRQIAETVKEGFFVFETDSYRYSYLNPAIINLTGNPIEPSADEPSYARGMSHWLNNIHPDDRPRIEAQLQEEQQGKSSYLEYRFLHPDGRLLWLRSKAFPIIEDATGKAVRIIGIVENITEGKLLEQALRDSEELFRRAFDAAPIGVSLIAPDGRFLKANRYFCNLLGYTEEELLQMHFQALTHPDDLEADLAGLDEMRRGDIQTFQMEKRYVTKQGDVVPVYLSASFVHDTDGNPLYSIGHTQDIRDRLAVDRMKDDFVSVVSHELRTPITSIEGSLMLLQSGVYKDRPKKAQSMLEIAINNSHRLVRLVDDILSFERLESGNVELAKEPCQVKDLIQQAIDSVSPLADRAAVALKITPCEATIDAAPDAIVQALTNLLTNAIKFSAPGQTVEVTAREQHEPATILFSVADQGRGIPPEKQQSIFEQFQQVDVSDSRQKGGTGLGLAICKRIVQQHSGEIWVESELGQGSTFLFTVPDNAEA
jgi:PAS domain S-box-containing protein